MFASLFIFGVVMFAITYLSTKLTDADVMSSAAQPKARPLGEMPSDIEFYRAVPRIQ